MPVNGKMTACLSPVTAVDGQSLSQNSNESISKISEKSKDEFEEGFLRRRMRMLSNPDYLHTVSLGELYDTAYQPKMQIVENLLTSGLYLFVGAPKIGKSFFMAQLGYHVSCGKPLWEYATDKGTVLYLALEDNYARLQKRLSQMFGVGNAENFDFATSAKYLKKGLDGQLEKFVKDNPETKLIIIDTLQKVREAGGDKYSYAGDYEIVAQLKQFADKNNICVVVVHHTRKASASDCFEMISGTNGLLGAADGAFIMQKEKRTDNKAVLEIVGRDQQDQRLHLLFDREHCVWQFEKAETELWKEPPDPLLDAIAKVVSPDSPEWIGSASELLDKLDGVDVQPNVLTRRLNVNADRLWNEYGIRIESSRTHTGRTIKLTLSDKKA